MARLDVQRLAPQQGQQQSDVVLHTPRNWAAVLFLAGLGALHLFLASTAFFHRRWEGYLSLIFAVAFGVASVACAMFRTELAVLAAARQLRIRTGTRRLYIERVVPFGAIRSVRLTLLDPTSPTSAQIELVCAREVIECPPTRIPREEALCLAVTMGVRLVKVYGEHYNPVSERLDRMAASSPSSPQQDA